jgi:hypothetical protein
MIKSVYKFPNGMVAVFDENGKQIPEYQGKWKDLEEKINENANDKTEWYIKNG